MKNSLNVDISRPEQELFIMVGVPGSGKSTKAKELVGNGVIHSTDEVIEAMGDYREFFNKMISSGDLSLTDVSGVINHPVRINPTKPTLLQKVGSLSVIIDNTNLKHSEPRNYVMAAFKLGYDDKNIKFIDIGTGGLSAEELAERNTHGVPLDKIKSMIQSYNSSKPITLNKVLTAKDMYSSKPKMFASLVIDDSYRLKLIQSTSHYIPEGWKVIARHMTINFGKGLPENLKSDLEEKKLIKATEIGISEMAVAVRVEGYHSDNKIPHITLAVNPNGGKPVMSNDITEWEPLDSYINVYGVVSEEKLG